MLPVLRTNLKNVSSKNQSLQDILKSCKYGYEILSVEPWSHGIHNTKITISIDQGYAYPKDQRFVKRVHFYNRLKLSDVIQGMVYNTTDINLAVEDLNLQGCDFTTDDVELVGGVISAIATSLGYTDSEPSSGVDSDRALFVVTVNGDEQVEYSFEYQGVNIDGTVIGEPAPGTTYLSKLYYLAQRGWYVEDDDSYMEGNETRELESYAQNFDTRDGFLIMNITDEDKTLPIASINSSNTFLEGAAFLDKVNTLRPRDQIASDITYHHNSSGNDTVIVGASKYIKGTSLIVTTSGPSVSFGDMVNDDVEVLNTTVLGVAWSLNDGPINSFTFDVVNSVSEYAITQNITFDFTNLTFLRSVMDEIVEQMNAVEGQYFIKSVNSNVRDSFAPVALGYLSNNLPFSLSTGLSCMSEDYSYAGESMADTRFYIFSGVGSAYDAGIWSDYGDYVENGNMSKLTLYPNFNFPSHVVNIAVDYSYLGAGDVSDLNPINLYSIVSK